jgi:YVTN family beta-propeller protein
MLTIVPFQCPQRPSAARGALRAAAAVLAGLGLGAGVALAQPRLFATQPAASQVVGVDLDIGGAAITHAAGTTPAGAVVSADGSRLFVADAGAGELRRIDPTSGPLDSVAVGDGPAGVALCAGGARLAVALAQDDAVAVVDAAALSVTGTLPVGDQPLAVACAEGFLAVANYGSGTLSVFDATTLTPLGTATVGVFPAGVAIGGGRAWVTSLFDSTVTVVALPAATVAATVSVGSGPRGIAIAGGRVFVGNVNDGTLTVLDLLTMAVTGTVPLAAAGPTELLADGATGNLYVAHLGEPSISIVSPVTLAVVDTLAAPTGLLGLAGVVVGEGVEPAAIPALGPLGLAALAAALAFLALRWRGGAAALLVGALAAGGAAHAQTVAFADDDFAPADWEVASATGTHAELQSPFNGNPPPSREMVHLHLPGSTIGTVHRWLAESHDPATEGTVASLAWSWDRRAAGGDCSTSQPTEAFVVFQDGVAYRGNESTFSSLAWESVGASGLLAADFDDGTGGTPDFSATGAALFFGFVRTTTNSSAGPAQLCHGIDNLAVTLTLEGEPEATVLAFSELEHFVIAGDDLVVGVTRSGNLEGPASVEVLLSFPTSAGPTRIASWPASVGGEVTVTFESLDVSEGGDSIAVLPLQLINESAGAVRDPERRRALVFLGTDGVALLWAAVALLLASWEPLGLLLLLALAAWAALRHQRHQAAHGGAGHGADQMRGGGRGAAELRPGRPQPPLLGGELAHERDEHHEAEPTVATEDGGAARGE